MISSVEQYLAELKKELAGSDRATVQDALSDAEEYLRTALLHSEADASEAEALKGIIEKYGRPEEVASAYKEVKNNIRRPPLQAELQDTEATSEPPRPEDNRPFYIRFFSVYTDSRTWRAVLYILFAFMTGIIYFSWAVTGLSLSLGLLVLIIGIPFASIFLVSVRGITLMEGRVVEALLGIRMPRRPLFSRQDIGWRQKAKSMFLSRHTWSALGYMILQLPLGTIYFSLFIVLIAVSLWAIALPFLQLSFDIPLFTNYGNYYYLEGWTMPFIIIFGILLCTATMHLARVIGRIHARMAKAMLVRE